MEASRIRPALPRLRYVHVQGRHILEWDGVLLADSASSLLMEMQSWTFGIISVARRNPSCRLWIIRRSLGLIKLTEKRVGRDVSRILD